MLATLFSQDGRCRAVMEGSEASCQATATMRDERLIEGDYRDHYWPPDEEAPLLCATLPYTDLVLGLGATLTVTEGGSGDRVSVHGETYVLENTEPVELTFSSPGDYVVELDYLGYVPCAFKVTVHED